MADALEQAEQRHRASGFIPKWLEAPEATAVIELEARLSARKRHYRNLRYRGLDSPANRPRVLVEAELLEKLLIGWKNEQNRES